MKQFLLKKNILNFAFAVLTVFMMGGNVWGQTTIFNAPGGGAYPNGSWTDVNNVINRPIDEGSYYNVEAGSPSDIITTSVYDLSSYASATFELDVASYGSGSYNPAKIEISYDGGSTYLETYTSTVTTGSSYIYGGSFTLSSVSSQVVLRITNNGTSGRGVRLRNLKLEATLPVGPNLIATPSSLTGLGYILGSVTSAAQTFVLSGNSLNNTNVDLNLTNADFELSKDGTLYSSSLTYPLYDGSPKTVYVRLKTGESLGNYTDQIDIAGGGATTINVSLDADVTPVPYDVIFDANGGTGTMANQSIVSGATESLNVNTFTNGTNIFDGWSTSVGGPVDYLDGASYTMGTADVTLYAQWSVYTGPCFSMNGPDFSNTTGYTTGGDNDGGGSPTSTIRLASGSSGGSISTTATGVNAGDITVKFRAKGWSSSETDVTVTVDGSSQFISTLPTSFGEVTVDFLGVSANPVIEFSTVKDKRVHIGNVEIICSPAGPEIDVLGNSTSIISGSNSPNLIDHTDFGQVAVAGGTFTRTFTIENTGQADLNLTGASPYVAIGGINAADFSITANPTTPIAQAGSTTFTVEFDPSATGLRTAVISIDNDDADEDPYYFTIQGTGVNSNSSDIIETSGFGYTSNIDYAAYQSNFVNTTLDGVASFGFTVRDGGGVADSDVLETRLSSIAIGVTNFSTIRGAALYSSSGTFITNASSISGGEITFSGLGAPSTTAPDDGSIDLLVYVSYQANVTDNVQLQFTVNSATAISSGSVFAAVNAGGATSDITGDINRLEVTATKLAFTQQPTTTSINGTMAPSPQVSAVDGFGNVDLDYTTGNVVVTSTGTMTGSPISAPYSNGVATFASVEHTMAGTGFTLSATSGTLTSATSTPFDITTIVYLNGDYRTTGSGTWISNNASPAIWESYSGGTWSTSNSPSYNTSNNVYIRNGHTITSGGSFGNSVNLKIQNGGEFVVEHNSTAATMYVYENGFLTVNNNLDIDGAFDVENNAWVTLNHAFSNPTTSIWKGTENFRPESILYITDWNHDKPLYNDDVSSNTHNGYTAAFGNVYIDLTGGAGIKGHWNLLGSSTGTVNLTHGNFEFDSPYGFDIRFFAETGDVANPTIHGNLKLNSGWSAARSVALGTAGTINMTVDGNLEIDSPGNFILRQANSASSPVSLTVNGDILINGPNVTSNTDFYLNYNIYSSSVSAKATLNLRGDLIVKSDASIINRGPYEDAFFNFDGTAIQNVNVASVVTSSDKGIPFFVKDGAQVQLNTNNLTINSGSTIEVEAGGTFDFNWTGSTPLLVLDGGSNESVFHSYPSSVLKITSLDGIVSTGPTGNVRTTTRTFDDLGDFHYIGLNNQNTGSALPSSIRNLYINNSGGTGSNYVTLSTGMKEVHNTLTMTQGHVVSTPSSLLSLGASVSELGTLDYTSGYVLGVMRRWFNSTNAGDATGLFPMGFDELGLKNRHAKVEFNNAPSAGGYLDVTFIYTPMGVAGLPIPMANTGGANFDVTTAEDQGYWRMDNQSTKLEGGNYTLTLTGEGFEVITDLSKLTVLKRVVANGSDWFCPGTHLAPTGTIAMPIISRAGITGWSNFGFGGDYDMNPLPIELTAFEVACVGNGQQIEINWTTASETNSSHYIIEKSRDGINWSEVAEVNAAGNSTSIIDYQEIDLNPWDDVSYYRLKQFDFDGNMSAFGPISTSCVIGESEAKVYPNPSTGEFTVEIDWNESAVNTKLQIIDLTGKVVHVQGINLKEGVKQIHFNQMNLQSGVYFVVLQQTQLKPLSLVISK